MMPDKLPNIIIGVVIGKIVYFLYRKQKQETRYKTGGRVDE